MRKQEITELISDKNLSYGYLHMYICTYIANSATTQHYPRYHISTSVFILFPNSASANFQRHHQWPIHIRLNAPLNPGENRIHYSKAEQSEWQQSYVEAAKWNKRYWKAISGVSTRINANYNNNKNTKKKSEILIARNILHESALFVRIATLMRRKMRKLFQFSHAFHAAHCCNMKTRSKIYRERESK